MLQEECVLLKVKERCIDLESWSVLFLKRKPGFVEINHWTQGTGNSFLHDTGGKPALTKKLKKLIIPITRNIDV